MVVVAEVEEAPVAMVVAEAAVEYVRGDDDRLGRRGGHFGVCDARHMYRRWQCRKHMISLNKNRNFELALRSHEFPALLWTLHARYCGSEIHAR